MAEKKKKKKKALEIPEGVVESGQVSQEEFNDIRDQETSPEEKDRGAIFDIEEEFSDIDSGTKSALSYFLPQVIAGLGAGLVGGTDAALAASSEAERQMKGFREAKLTEAKTQRQQAGPNLRPMRTDFITRNNRPAIMVGTKLVEAGTGRVIPDTEQLVDPVTQRQKANLEIRSESLGLQKQKASQLTEKQVENIQNIQVLDSQIERMDKLGQDVATGIVRGRLQSFAQLADLAPEKFTKLRSQSDALVLQFTKTMQGSRPSDMDLEFVERMIPRTTDGDRAFAAKLDLIKDFMSSQKAAIKDAITKGQPLRKGTVKTFFKSKVNKTANPDIDAKKALQIIQDIKNKRKR